MRMLKEREVLARAYNIPIEVPISFKFHRPKSGWKQP